MHEIIILSNGKRVGNFSSPHSFTFEDGMVLPAVSNSVSELLKIQFVETEYPNGDVSLDFSITPEVRVEMDTWMRYYHNADVNVVFCPLPMVVALKNEGYDLINSPFRSIRIEDRIKKLVSINKQCI